MQSVFHSMKVRIPKCFNRNLQSGKDPPGTVQSDESRPARFCQRHEVVTFYIKILFCGQNALYAMASSVYYQNLLGMNVLTIRI